MLCLAALLLGSLAVEDVFVCGTLDAGQVFQVFRIPALCRTSKGTLLAFAEGRRSIQDQSANVLVLRRKLAHSQQWAALRVIADKSPASLNNPCVLEDGGTVFLMYQRYPAGKTEWNSPPGVGVNACQTFLLRSSDEGATWSKPVDLTPIVKGYLTQSTASGPGSGIKLERGAFKGRLIFPCNEGAQRHWSTFAVYSDDHGRTWNRGVAAPRTDKFEPNEVQMVETSDGQVLQNARNQASGHFRLQSVSHDGGGTWERIEPRQDLPDPVCQGSILRLGWSPNRIVLCNPASIRSRENGSLRTSSDDGKTWSAGLPVAEGSFEYSSLCKMPAGKVGILYETKEVRNGLEGYRIRFTVVIPDARL